MKKALFCIALLSSLVTIPAGNASAQTAAAQASGDAAPDEAVLGVVPVVDDGKGETHVIKLAILPSLSPDMEDVIVRSVVRKDFELTGMFDVIADAKSPPGLYGFEDPVDIDAWRNLGAEVIVKVAAKAQDKDHVKIFGLCYFLNTGQEPVYEKTFVVKKEDTRVTAHRITDALLGAITGTNGGFASRLSFSAPWGGHHTVFTIDADGHNIDAVAPKDQTSIAPAFGPGQKLFYAMSKNYSPFFVVEHDTGKKFDLPFKQSIYSLAWDDKKERLAVAVAEPKGSSVYLGNADGTDMKKVSTTEIATHPVFSPTGKLAWVGGGGKNGTQRVYVDGKPVSPAGFAASAPVFCRTEDGIFLIMAVSVGNGNQDLILMNERGGNVTRLTQHKGSNTYPACSPDGRMLAFFSTRKAGPGLYVKSLKSWKTQRISSRVGQSLRWDALPPAKEFVAEPPKKKTRKKHKKRPKKNQTQPAPQAEK